MAVPHLLLERRACCVVSCGVVWCRVVACGGVSLFRRFVVSLRCCCLFSFCLVLLGCVFACLHGSHADAFSNGIVNGWRLAGSWEEIKCPQGHYCEAPDEIQACQASLYCPAGSGIWQVCPAQHYCPGDGSVKIPCPDGYFCNQGSDEPTKCSLLSDCHCDGGCAEPHNFMSIPVLVLVPLGAWLLLVGFQRYNRHRAAQRDRHTAAFRARRLANRPARSASGSDFSYSALEMQDLGNRNRDRSADTANGGAGGSAGGTSPAAYRTTSTTSSGATAPSSTHTPGSADASAAPGVAGGGGDSARSSRAAELGATLLGQPSSGVPGAGAVAGAGAGVGAVVSGKVTQLDEECDSRQPSVSVGSLGPYDAVSSLCCVFVFVCVHVASVHWLSPRVVELVGLGCGPLWICNSGFLSLLVWICAMAVRVVPPPPPPCVVGHGVGCPVWVCPVRSWVTARALGSRPRSTASTLSSGTWGWC